MINSIVTITDFYPFAVSRWEPWCSVVGT